MLSVTIRKIIVDSNSDNQLFESIKMNLDFICLLQLQPLLYNIEFKKKLNIIKRTLILKGSSFLFCNSIVKNFEESTFLKRVFDEHYVKSDEYSELLVKEIPKRQKANIAIEVILQRKKRGCI